MITFLLSLCLAASVGCQIADALIIRELRKANFALLDFNRKLLLQYGTTPEGKARLSYMAAEHGISMDSEGNLHKEDL